MSIKSIAAASLAFCVFAGSAGAAVAQGWYHDPYERSYGRRYDLPYAGPSDRYGRPVRTSRCIKMCPQDNNPCDPINYKIADARCTNRW